MQAVAATGPVTVSVAYALAVAPAGTWVVSVAAAAAVVAVLYEAVAAACSEAPCSGPARYPLATELSEPEMGQACVSLVPRPRVLVRNGRVRGVVGGCSHSTRNCQNSVL